MVFKLKQMDLRMTPANDKDCPFLNVAQYFLPCWHVACWGVVPMVIITDLMLNTLHTWDAIYLRHLNCLSLKDSYEN